jgi:replication-associated recombination protein RarA
MGLEKAVEQFKKIEMEEKKRAEAVDLLNKYRPKKFSEFLGNKTTIKITINAVKNYKSEAKTAKNGILIHGLQGTGKTSLAYLIVKALSCENFVEDICDECGNCKSFRIIRDYIWFGAPYQQCNCTKMNKAYMDYVLEGLERGKRIANRGITIFDEFHRTNEPLQEKLLDPLEFNNHMLLIFCAIDIKKISQAFLGRVLKLPVRPPEVDELIPWLRKICDSMEITVKGIDALPQLALSAGRIERDCLSFLEQARLRNEPLTTALVKEIAEDQDYQAPEYTIV